MRRLAVVDRGEPAVRVLSAAGELTDPVTGERLRTIAVSTVPRAGAWWAREASETLVIEAPPGGVVDAPDLVAALVGLEFGEEVVPEVGVVEPAGQGRGAPGQGAVEPEQGIGTGEFGGSGREPDLGSRHRGAIPLRSSTAPLSISRRFAACWRPARSGSMSNVSGV